MALGGIILLFVVSDLWDQSLKYFLGLLDFAFNGFEIGIDIQKLLPMLVHKLHDLLTRFRLNMLKLIYFLVQQQEIYLSLRLFR